LLPSPPATGPAKRTRAPKTTWAQYVAILEWLEIPANFNLIEGSAISTMKTGTVANAKLTKRTAFAELADAVNEKCNTNWDRVTSIGESFSSLQKIIQAD
jgi:hypothetical protein